MKKLVNILWTGGWDSTFCVLDFLLLRNCLVQPIYLLDPERKSTAQELAAMDRIRCLLVDFDPAAATRLLETKTIPAEPPGPDDPWENALDAMRAEGHFGSQYSYIARTIALHRLDPVELSIEAPGRISDLLKKHVSEISVAGAIDHVLPASPHPDDPVHVLFRDCRFPLIRITKNDMASIAREHGWTPLMHETWFCHLPRPGDRPCGFCNPCNTVIKDGLGWRLPWIARVRHVWHRRVRDCWPRFYRKASWVGRRFGVRR